VARNAHAHFISGRLADGRVHGIAGKTALADQFVISRVFMGHRVAGVACRCPLGSPLPVDNHDTSLRVQLRQGMGRTETGNACTDNQPVGFFNAFEVITDRGTSCQGNPATFIFHVSPHLPVRMQRGVCIHALFAWLAAAGAGYG
jgi:hypothetical protein